MKNRKLIRDNADTAVRILFKYHKLEYDGYAEHLHHLHPLYPSLQSVSYICSLYGLDSALIETDCDEISDLPHPFIILYDGLFLPISHIDNEGCFIIINEKGIEENTALKCTDHRWRHTALVINRDGVAQNDSPIQKMKWRLHRSSLYLVFFMLVVLLSLTLFYCVRSGGLYVHLLLMTSIFGVIISVLFHLQKLDRSNPFINKICHSNRKSARRDCSSILDSRASEVLGLVSWVDVGAVYFLLYLCVILFCPSKAYLQVLAFISIGSSLYIPYSIFYQKHVARKWCTLCLLVQAILFINACFSIVYLKHRLIDFEGFFTASLRILCTSIIIASFYSIIIFIVKKYSLQSKSNNQFRKIMFSKRGLNLLVFDTKEYAPPTSKIDLVTKDGINNIMLVVNPHCSPCITKLRRTLTIINRKRYTSLSIVFLIDEDDTDSINLAKYLIIKSLQDDAFRVFKEYVDSYPSLKKCTINDSNTAIDIIKAHRNWCRDNDISSTPQVLLNGHILSNLYSVDDLDYLID